jgi:GcrA cell cycle regulator
MEWSEETVAQLSALWADGLSTAEIGRRIGISQNAVVGKAHRIGLTPRPSPIRREQPGGTASRAGGGTRRVIGSTLPPLPGCGAAAALPGMEPPPAARPAARTPAPAVVPLRPAEAVAAPVRVVASRSGRLVPCCWPIGEPGTKSFRFCDQDAVSGKPYCAEHAQLAYVKVRDKRDEAA